MTGTSDKWTGFDFLLFWCVELSLLYHSNVYLLLPEKYKNVLNKTFFFSIYGTLIEINNQEKCSQSFHNNAGVWGAVQFECRYNKGQIAFLLYLWTMRNLGSLTIFLFLLTTFIVEIICKRSKDRNSGCYQSAPNSQCFRRSQKNMRCTRSKTLCGSNYRQQYCCSPRDMGLEWPCEDVGDCKTKFYGGGYKK